MTIFPFVPFERENRLKRVGRVKRITDITEYKERQKSANAARELPHTPTWIDLKEHRQQLDRLLSDIQNLKG